MKFLIINKIVLDYRIIFMSTKILNKKYSYKNTKICRLKIINLLNKNL